MPFSHAGQRAYEPRPSVYMCSLKEETNSTTTPQRPRLVVSRRTCPPLSPSPHANIFIIGTAVINTVHRCSLVSRYGSGTICRTTENNQASYTVRATVHRQGPPRLVQGGETDVQAPCLRHSHLCAKASALVRHPRDRPRSRSSKTCRTPAHRSPHPTSSRTYVFCPLGTRLPPWEGGDMVLFGAPRDICVDLPSLDCCWG